MSLLFNIEGPKGSGKTSVTQELAAKFNAELLKFDSDVIVRNKDFTYAEEHDVIFERGILSYLIYDFLWDNGVSPLFQSDFSNKSITIKTPIQKNHFDQLMSKLKYKLVIIYAKDTAFLANNINMRHVTVGKGANTLEWDSLNGSNAYFKAMGQFLSEMYPGKVLCIDSQQFESTSAMTDFILQEIEV